MRDSQPLVRQLPWQCSLYTNIRPSPYLVVSTYVEDTVIGRLILLTGSLQLPKRRMYLCYNSLHLPTAKRIFVLQNFRGGGGSLLAFRKIVSSCPKLNAK